MCILSFWASPIIPAAFSSKLTAEYALKDINKPIGVSEYKLSDFVPEDLAGMLPTAEDVEKRIQTKHEIKD